MSYFATFFYSNSVQYVVQNIFEYLAFKFLFSGGRMFYFLEAMYHRNFDKIRIKTPSSNPLVSNAPDWENPNVSGRNRRPAHVRAHAFASKKSALEYWTPGQHRTESKSAKVLSNIFKLTDSTVKWDFAMFGSPEDVPINKSEIPVWHKIPVPSHWQLEGFDIPIYTNTTYPFAFDPPHTRRVGEWLPTDCDTGLGGTTEKSGALHAKEPGPNATGVYRRTFTLPVHWNDDANAIAATATDRYFLTFDGVDACMTVWIDGHYVGYSQDSCLPAEYEVTQWLSTTAARSSEHTLTVQVLRWCDGSYLEDQDKWWLSGIYRDVYIIRKPQMHIHDYEVLTDIPSTSGDSATVSVQVQLSSSTQSMGSYAAVVKAELWLSSDLQLGSPVATTQGQVIRDSTVQAFPNRLNADKRVSNGSSDINTVTSTDCFLMTEPMTLMVPSPLLWSAEQPNLYTLVISLYASLTDAESDATPIDIEATRMGLRTVTIGGKHNWLCVNGQPITVAGVNRHEFEPKTGRTVSEESMWLDAKLMKRLNFNAVRCAHYPNATRWLEICDEVGLYVVDEANIETHGFQMLGQAVGYLADKPEWIDAYVLRATRMLERDKNYPSVILWSLGNESGVGQAHRDMKRWLNLRNPRRLVQYESGGARSNVTDIICPMYMRPDWCTEKLFADSQNRPVILCEYAHAMGNSGGCLSDYWSHFWDDKFHRFQGGFIWDWVDQGLLPVGSHASEKTYLYGGDFGDVPNTKQFCINGLLGPDRVPHPSVIEAAFLQSPVLVQLQERACELYLAMWNRRSHTSLDDVTIAVAVHTDYDSALDLAPLKGSINLAERRISPQSDLLTPLKDLIPALFHGHVSSGDARLGQISEVFLLVTVSSQVSASESFVLSSSTLSHTLLTQAFQSYLYTSSVSRPLPAPGSSTAVKFARANNFSKDIHVQWADDSFAVVSGVTGQITEWVTVSTRRESVKVLTAPIDLCLWRAVTDNDRGGGPLSHETRWKQAGYDKISLQRSKSCKVNASTSANGTVVVKAQWQLLMDSSLFLPYFAKVVPCEAVYTFAGDKSVTIKIQIELPSYFPTLPRFGVRFAMPSSFQHATWFGLGPHECYVDRRASARLGQYSSTVADLHVPYVYPQENGSRLDPRYVCLNDTSTGSSLLIRPIYGKNDTIEKSKVYSWSASPYSLEMLDSTLHEHDLPALMDGNTYVHLDRAMTGVGGYDSWSPNIKEDFLLYPSQCTVFEAQLSPLHFATSNMSLEQVAEDAYHRSHV